MPSLTSAIESPNKLYRHLRLQDVVITLINGKDEVLSGFSQRSKTYARQSLEKRGVKLLLNTQVKELTAQDILLADQTRISCNLAIWAGGLKGAPLADAISLQHGQGGRIEVQPDLSLSSTRAYMRWGTSRTWATEAGRCFPN